MQHFLYELSKSIAFPVFCKPSALRTCDFWINCSHRREVVTRHRMFNVLIENKIRTEQINTMIIFVSETVVFKAGKEAALLNIFPI